VLKKILLWTLFGGMMAYPIEGLWRIPSNGGWVSIFMLPVYGLCFFLIGNINQIPAFYRMSMRLQTLIGAAIVLFVELLSGIILNLWLGLNIWDYSSLPANVLGQISLLFGVLWLLLIPFAVWLEDKLNWIWEKAHGREAEYNYTLLQAYKELFRIGKEAKKL